MLITMKLAEAEIKPNKIAINRLVSITASCLFLFNKLVVVFILLTYFDLNIGIQSLLNKHR